LIFLLNRKLAEAKPIGADWPSVATAAAELAR